jgi:hypothetical protein
LGSRQSGSKRHPRFRPTFSRPCPRLDCACLGHRRGRNHPGATAALRTISGTEIVEEDASLTYKSDKYGRNCKCQFAVPIVPLSIHLVISPILDDTNNTNNVGIAASTIQFIVFSVSIETIDQSSYWRNKFCFALFSNCNRRS